MATTPYSIIAAPFTVWTADVGTTFPAVDDTPSASWTKLGTSGDKDITEDGVKITHNQDITEFRTLGTTGPRKAVRTSEGITIEFDLVDMTIEQYATALNDASVTTVAAASGTAGEKNIKLHQGFDVTQFALLIRGASPQGDDFTMQYEIPVAYQAAEPEPAYTKGDMAMLHFEWHAIEDSSASAGAEFGTLRQQTAAATS